jgi:hypothetical protein
MLLNFVLTVLKKYSIWIRGRDCRRGECSSRNFVREAKRDRLLRASLLVIRELKRDLHVPRLRLVNLEHGGLA